LIGILAPLAQNPEREARGRFKNIRKTIISYPIFIALVTSAVSDAAIYIVSSRYYYFL